MPFQAPRVDDDDVVPSGRVHPIPEFGEEAAAGPGPCRLGWGRDGGLDLGIVDQSAHGALGRETVVEAAVGIDVVVLEVDQREAGVVPAELITGAEPLEQAQLGGPVEPVRARHRVLLERVQDLPPLGEDLERPCGSAGAVADEARDPLQDLALHVERGELPAVGERHGLGEARVVADRVDRGDRVLRQQVGEVDAGFDRVQHQARGADLEVGRELGHVGVADDHVQPPPDLVRGVRFVAGVDDPSPQGGLEPGEDLDVVRTLRDLEPGSLTLLADPHPAGTGIDLPGQQVCGETDGERVEVDVAAHEVVLVCTVGGALAVDVVLVELELRVPPGGRRLDAGTVHDHLAGLVPDHSVPRGVDLGGRVLGVCVVDVEPGPVGEHPVGHAEFARVIRAGDTQIEAACIAQRGLRVVAPVRLVGAPGALAVICVGLDHLGRGDDRAEHRLPHGDDAELDLGADDPPADGVGSPHVVTHAPSPCSGSTPRRPSRPARRTTAPTPVGWRYWAGRCSRRTRRPPRRGSRRS